MLWLLVGASFDLVLGAPRHFKIEAIFSSIFGTILLVIFGPRGSSFWCLFPSFSVSIFGKHFQGVWERPGDSFSSSLSMKTKVLFLPPWLHLEVVFGVKMGF